MEHFYDKIHGWFDFQNLYSSAVSYFPDNSRFIEIGVWKGKSLAYLGVEIINSGKKIKLDAVDTWEGSPVHKDKNSGAYDEITEIDGALFKEFKSNIEPIKEIVNVVKLPSVEASKLYEDKTFDFIFIDADHEMPHVLNDIESWYPKLKENGWFTGHDAGYGPVQEALSIFCNKKNLTYEINNSSWVIKI